VCGRYSLATPASNDLRARFALGESLEIRQRFNVAPGDDIVAVTTTKEGEPRGDLLRWGLVPFWAKDIKVGYKMINARAETIADKPAFRDALTTRRCLIVADGFYEWQTMGSHPPRGRKQPWHVTRADGAPFAFAGLWAIWHGGDADEPLRSATIITTEANRALADIHDRMPVILTPSGEEPWLHANEPPRGVIEGELKLTPVGTAVNDARHDEPDCLDPPAEAPATLF